MVGMLWSRRRLMIGAALTGAAALGGVWGLRSSGYSLPAELAGELRVLSPAQFVVVNAVGRRILAPVDHDVGRFVDGYLTGMNRADQRDVLLLIGFVEQLAPLLEGYARRFTALKAAEQDEVLAALESNPSAQLRAGFQALKSLALMDYYRRPESWAALGYDGPVVDFLNR